MNRPYRILVMHETPHHAAMSGRSGGNALLAPDAKVDGLGRGVPFKVAWTLSRVSRGDEYNTLAFQREAEAVRTGRREAGGEASVHYLSAEHDTKYVPLLARRLGWHTSAWFHKPGPTITRLMDRRRSLHRLDRAWAVSASQVPALAERLGADRVGVLHLGVDTDQLTPPEAPRGRSVLFLGAHLRDFAQLRRVYRRLAELDPTIDLRVVVPSHATALVSGTAGTVQAGITDDALVAELRRAGVVYLPLVDSTANVTLLEALACGCPVVATDVGGVREYAGEAAVLVDPGDDDAAVESIVRLLDDTGAATTLAADARIHSLDFSWPAVTAGFTWAGDPSGRRPPTGSSR